MLLQGWSCLYSCNNIPLQSQNCSSQPKITIIKRRTRRKDKSSSCTINNVFGFNEISEITHNKVLVSAAVSAAIGQLSKPFTSTILSGKKYEIDISVAFQSGGFPSTHSSAVVATATALGLERGFSDAIFGLAVVYASLVMYDAQGVRREVGVHAKVLNKIIVHQNSCSGPESSFEPRVLNLDATPTRSPNVEVQTKSVLESDNKKVINGVEREGSEKTLKESVGHSEIEVLAGALLGLLVSLTVNAII